MNIKDISIVRLKEYENNPRNNDLAVEKVKYSIDRFGFLFPIVIDINYVIVCGHTRVRACRELGIQTVPCIIADELTDEQINLFRLVDNKSSEYSDWDFEKLKNELSLVDLTLEKNQLLLDRFELSAEVFDIDAEQAEIKIPSFNFMSDKDKPKEKKATVSTINVQGENLENNDNIERNDMPEQQTENIPPSNFTAKTANTSINTERIESIETEVPAKKESKAVLQFCQFRFGDVSFFISQIELERLNEKYAEYIDSGAVLEGSFANYILKGVEKNA